MKKQDRQFFEELESKINSSYKSGISMVQAEASAFEFLEAQMRLSALLRTCDLDTRMRKSGLKAIRAAIYMDAINKNEKKPTEAFLAAIIDTDEIVLQEQKGYDEAEAERADLERWFDILNNAHIMFRGVSKGSM